MSLNLMHPELTQLTHAQLHPPRFSGDKAKRCKIILGTLGMPGYAQVPPRGNSPCRAEGACSPGSFIQVRQRGQLN